MNDDPCSVMDSQPLAQSRPRVGRMGVARPLARW